MRSVQTTPLSIHRIELPTPFAVGTVNVYLIEDCEECVLIDCGPHEPAAEQALRDGFERLGRTFDDVTALVLTHGHVDHVGMTHLFQARGIPVFSHPDVSLWLDPGGFFDTYRMRFFARLYDDMGMPMEDQARAFQEFSSYREWNDRSVVDVPLNDGSLFPPMPQFRVVYVPGHAQAAIGLLNQETHEFFSGDQVLPHISSNAFIEPVLGADTGEKAERTKSLIHYRNNLEYLRTLSIQKVYPGHGEIFEHVDQLLNKRLEEQLVRRDKMFDVLHKVEPCSAYELATIVFSKHRNQGSLILSETLGYLDWLYDTGEVTATMDSDGVIRWEVNR